MSDNMNHGRVVLGYDGSPGAERALAWAARTAAAAGRQLDIVLAVPKGSLGDSVKDEPLLRGALHVMVGEAADEARDAFPRLSVRTFVADGPAARTLIEHTTSRDLLVTGSRGRGGFTGLALGSVSFRVCAQAPCPVVVVPPTAVPDDAGAYPGGVAVAAADLEDLPAVTFAVDHAAVHGGPVRIVHAWVPVLTVGGPAEAGALLGDLREEAAADRALLARLTAEVRETAPGVEIIPELHRGSAAGAMLSESEKTGLLVVGVHRHPITRHLPVGPTVIAVLHHAKQPVAVVPIHHGEEDGRDDT